MRKREHSKKHKQQSQQVTNPQAASPSSSKSTPPSDVDGILVTPDQFELLMDRFEKEAFFQATCNGI